jgi:hypothetical protein
VFGLLTIPAGLVFLIGIMLDEPHMPNFAYRQVLFSSCLILVLLSSWSNICWTQVNQKFLDAGKAMWATLKCPDVWKPCLYMYFSIALSLDIHEGMFYWYTDSKGGPLLSQVWQNSLSAMARIQNIVQYTYKKN